MGRASLPRPCSNHHHRLRPGRPVGRLVALADRQRASIGHAAVVHEEVITDDRHRSVAGSGRRPGTTGPRRQRPRRSPSASWPATPSARRARSGRPSGPAGSCRSGCRRASRPTTPTRSSCATPPGPAWSTSTATSTSTTTWASARSSPGTCTRPCATAVQAQLDDGTLYVTPCELNAEVAELLRRALRPADVALHELRHRGDDGRHPGRQGGDRPGQDRQGRGRLPRPPRRGDDLDEAAARPGRPGRRTALGARHGRHHQGASSPTRSSSPTTTPRRSSGCSPSGEVACFIVEPVMENIGICLPEPGYLEAVREITAAPRHAAHLRRGEDRDHRRLRRRHRATSASSPTSSRWPSRSAAASRSARSVASRSYMDLITAGQGAPPRHVQRQPAGDGGEPGHARRGLRPPSPSTRRSPATARSSAACQAIIDDADLPAHTVQFGAKGCVTWRREPVRNYRDYKATDFDLAFAQWIHGINRGVLLPPGPRRAVADLGACTPTPRPAATPRCSGSSSTSCTPERSRRRAVPRSPDDPVPDLTPILPRTCRDGRSRTSGAGRRSGGRRPATTTPGGAGRRPRDHQAEPAEQEHARRR